jgi:hypothetical protein
MITLSISIAKRIDKLVDGERFELKESRQEKPTCKDSQVQIKDWATALFLLYSPWFYWRSDAQ